MEIIKLKSHKIEKLDCPFERKIYISRFDFKRGLLTLILVFALIPFSLVAQSHKRVKKTKIEILNANMLDYDDSLGKGVRKLIGDVQFKHNGALMFCDSAYFYSKSNSMDAYGHVKVIQGTSLKLYGNTLKYNGDTQKAFLRGNIRMVNEDVTLTTNFLNYDRVKNEAYYYGGGTMVSQKESDTLTSKQGYYYPDTQSFFFKEDVVLINPKYQIIADTLKYNSASEIVYFLGPTTIKSETNFIYCENGWYNTNNNTSKFFENSYLYSEGKRIEGDTLYYDRDKGEGKITCNAVITDTIDNIIISGEIAHLFEKNDSAMVTQEALLMQLLGDDTLYMHADTFKVSTQQDTNRILLAYNNVTFFKKDMQGKADSVVYNFQEGTISFYTDPVIWSDENQLTADYIYILNKDGKLNTIYLLDRAFIISKADSLREDYNQIKGKNMTGHFKGGELFKISVVQNAETIYYAKDDKGKYIGVNKASSNNMLIFIKGNTLKSLTFIKDPEATLYPINQASPKDVILKGFSWRDDQRPKNFFDVFR